MSQSVRAQVRELLNIATSNKPQEGYTDARQWFEDRVIILIADMLSGLEMETWAHSEIGPLYDAGISKGIEIMNERISKLKAQLQEETK